VLPGPALAEHEWQSCIAQIDARIPATRYLVLSGSLPPGVPADAYARLANAARAQGVRTILDSSGAPLRAALEAGIFLVKPSLDELCELVGRALAGEAEWREAALEVIRRGQAQVVVLTLGSLGALLVSKDTMLRAPALPVTVCSAIGAGDALVGALVWALVRDAPLAEAFRYGLAAASASLAGTGTTLCSKSEVERLYRQVKIE